ncbi:MAG: D-alanyl-D-alanine carboxypeptidase [Chlamydiae bacterium]|nr:D-alanyl-D-alanine carboxypeptidase [Chlamydiota bacterium]MBI3265524.1 D-alanyl-D-alanine carboxypeptidase [Chlamydiota bacterium]
MKKQTLSIFFLLSIIPFSLQAKELKPKGTDIPVSSYLVVNADTGDILTQKNKDAPHAPASLTKIMTLYLTFEAVHQGKIHWDSLYTVPLRIAAIRGSEAKMWQGEKISARDLVKATAVGSANDAAAALAEMISGSQENFVQLMNEKAKTLGLKQTVFRSPHGLPPALDTPKDTTTACDLVRLTLAIWRDYPEVFQYSSQKQIFIRQGKYRFINTNKLIGKYPGMLGLKTGYTDEALYCLVGVAKQGNMRLISVLLGALTNKERSEYTRQLLNDGFNRFTNVVVPCKGQVFDIPIHHGKPSSDQGIASDNLFFMVPKDKASQVKLSIFIPPSLEAPITQGQIIAQYIATLDEETLARVNIEAKEEVKKAGFFRRMWGG